MSEADTKPIQGTERFQAVADPVFSPDGRSLAFHAVYDQTLKRIAVTGGAAVTITKADLPFGMHWGPDGIVYGQGSKGIVRVSPNGGAPETIVSVKEGETAHGPQIAARADGTCSSRLATGASPDRWNNAHIVVAVVGDGRTDDRHRRAAAMRGTSRQVTSSTRWAGMLLAVAFDVQRLEVIGQPGDDHRRCQAGHHRRRRQLLRLRLRQPGLRSGPASGSGAGQLDDLALVDRAGRVQPLKLPPGAYTTPRVSPDGTRIAFGAEDGNESTVWIYDLSGTSAMRRLTFGGNNRFPIWSSDGNTRRFSIRSGWRPGHLLATRRRRRRGRTPDEARPRNLA